MRLYARIEVRTCTCRLADAGMMGLLPDVIAAISNIAPETGNSRIYKVFRMVFNCFVSTSALITKVVSTKTLIKLKSKPVFSVQYHPESNPGPQDSVYLFEEFVTSMKKNAKKKRY